MKKINDNTAKIITIGGLGVVALIATVPVVGPAVCTGLAAKAIWLTAGVASIRALTIDEK